MFSDSIEARLGRLADELQLMRGRLERRIAGMRGRDHRPLVVATACWNFPVYSQTFVYQELTQLIQQKFAVRFLYSRLDSKKSLPPQFSSLWHRRRRLVLHPTVCDRNYAYFSERMPDKVDQLIEMLREASGMSAQELKRHHHFLQGFSFARMVEAYRPEYLHSYFFYEGTLFTLMASYLLDIPRGVSCYADHMLDDYALKVVPLHLRQCSLIVATSQQIRQELINIEKRLNPNCIVVKPNAINTAQFPVVTRKEPGKGQPYRLVCLSRIEPKKGLTFLVEAVGLLREMGYGVQLHLIGGVDANASSRDYAQQLRASIKSLDLEDSVHLEGRKTESEIKKFFKRSHLFVAPFVETEYGDKDGIPTSLLEAMASGFPVIATNAGSICEVIRDGEDGVLVPQRNSRALAGAIAELLENPGRRASLGSNAARKARENFDVKQCEHIFQRRLSALLDTERQSRELLATKSEVSAGPLVSVIVIFLNAEKFMEEALESVLAQTYLNWELLLVDDGSTDGSTEIARRYVERYPRKVRYLEHESHQNRGMSATRNLGIRNAHGGYIALLDADDVWLPHKLKRQVAILESEPEAGMVCGAPQYWHGWTGKAEDLKRDHIPDLGIQPDTLFKPPALTTLLYPLGTGTAPCPSDLLMRREMVTQLGGFQEDFTGEYQLYEDQAFLAKVYLRHAVFVSSECWDRYRIHPDSCVATVKQAGHYQTVRRFFLKWMERYLSQQHITDTGVLAALRRALSNGATQGPPSDLEAGTVAMGTGARAGYRDVELGELRRVTPISRNWGLDRGRPIDRYYIENFLASHASEIRGRVLEVGDNSYTRRFGGDRVIKSDVLHVAEGSPQATIIADLACADHIPSDSFDCIILTQTLQLIYDVRAAIKTVYRILKPGGVVLVTIPGISQTYDHEWCDHWFWNFTPLSARRIFEESFQPGNVEIETHGNVLTAISFLHGLAMEELRPEELDHREPGYALTITVRAGKSEVVAS